MSSRRSSDRVARWAFAGALVTAALRLPVMAADASASGAAEQVAPPVVAPVRRNYPSRAMADFNRAVDLARRGDSTEAELEFGQLAVAYPDFAGPQINIGLLRRKAGNLEASEQALRDATVRNPNSALAWSEYGVTLRMLGKFGDAEQAYRRAISADASAASAYRNLAILLDLYLDRPAEALAAMERYRELTGDDKQVASWVAELRQRVGRSQSTVAPSSSPPPAANEEKAP